MRLIAKNVYSGVKAALFFAAVPFLSLLLLWSEKQELGKGSGPIARAWLSFWSRVWDRAGDLADTGKVDVAVLFSSFVLSCWFVTLLLDPAYLDRYPTLLKMRGYAGGYWFWVLSTGFVSAFQFVSAFAYGMKDVNVRAWERACIVTTAVAAGLYIVMHGLIAWDGETSTSRMYAGLFILNLSYAVRFGFQKAVARSKAELSEVFNSRARMGATGRPRLKLSGKPR